jgi:hypothetical protein
VLSYGNSSLRLGVTQLSPKEGTSLGATGGGWTHQVYTVSPGVPGHRSPGAGRSAQHAAARPLAGANGVSDVSPMIS